MENENKRLFEWLNPGKCWHEEMVQTDDMPNRFWSPNCIHCGESDRGRYPPDNPKYTSNVGFFALLSGLRAKGFGVELRHQSENCLARLVKYAEIDADYDLDSPQTFIADTLPEALFKASLAALESEGTE